ncbi:hypothetical protein [Streptomyces maremycinicus]|uniref:hypothetical protein n=1 Tax=Streptomyces maremycinicus TaxID=1679753 RepID=UPI0007882F39
MSNIVLERAAQAFANATAEPPLLYELGVEGARKLLEDVQSGRPVRTYGRRSAAGGRRGAGRERLRPTWRDIPSWVLVATEDRNMPAQVQIFGAERTQATVVTVDVHRPGDVARLIGEAVRATG